MQYLFFFEACKVYISLTFDLGLLLFLLYYFVY